MSLELVTHAEAYGSRTAIVVDQREHSFAELVDASARVAASLLDGRRDLGEARVAFLVPPGFEYAAVQWGVWRAGGVAVPLPIEHPPREIEYLVDDAQPETIVAEAAAGSSPRPRPSALRLCRSPTSRRAAAR